MQPAARRRVIDALLQTSPSLTLRPTRLEDIEDLPTKHTHLLRQLTDDPALFLERYGKLLPLPCLSEFSPLSNDEEVAHYLSQLSPERPDAARSLRRNRRLRKLHLLEQHEAYFSEESIASREPELYQRYLGDFRSQPSSSTIHSLAELIYLQDKFATRREAQHSSSAAAAAAAACAHPNAAPSASLGPSVGPRHDSDGDASMEQEHTRPPGVPLHQADDLEPPPSSESERELRLAQLISILRDKFVFGHCEDIDYTQIDADASLDDLEQQGRDAEDAYFDT